MIFSRYSFGSSVRERWVEIEAPKSKGDHNNDSIDRPNNIGKAQKAHCCISLENIATFC